MTGTFPFDVAFDAVPGEEKVFLYWSPTPPNMQAWENRAKGGEGDARLILRKSPPPQD